MVWNIHDKLSDFIILNIDPIYTESKEADNIRDHMLDMYRNSHYHCVFDDDVLDLVKTLPDYDMMSNEIKDILYTYWKHEATNLYYIYLEEKSRK